MKSHCAPINLAIYQKTSLSYDYVGPLTTPIIHEQQLNHAKQINQPKINK